MKIEAFHQLITGGSHALTYRNLAERLFMIMPVGTTPERQWEALTEGVGAVERLLGASR